MSKSKILWVNGGLPCGTNSDLSIALLGLVPTLTALHEKAVADGTYQNEVFMNKIRDGVITNEIRDYNKYINRVLARHESVNKRIKNFAILSKTFRHGEGIDDRIFLHNQCFLACANLTQLMLEIEPLMAAAVP